MEINLLNQKNNPLKSGKYLCTCVNFCGDRECARYLQIMYYDKETNDWNDCDNTHKISHNIIAWTDKISVCDFHDYDYLAGGIFIKKKSQ